MAVTEDDVRQGLAALGILRPLQIGLGGPDADRLQLLGIGRADTLNLVNGIGHLAPPDLPGTDRRASR